MSTTTMPPVRASLLIKQYPLTRVLAEVYNLTQDAADCTSWVGRPGRQQFIAEPVYHGIVIQALGNGGGGYLRHLIGAGKPIQLYRVLARPTYEDGRPVHVTTLTEGAWYIRLGEYTSGERLTDAEAARILAAPHHAEEQ